MLKEKIYIEKVASEELAETQVNNFNKLIEILEDNNPDSYYMFDVNLSALIDYLHEAGYTDNNIIILNNNFYGDFIRFYYLTDYNLYMMEYGTC